MPEHNAGMNDFARSYLHNLYLVAPGARPPFFEVVDHVYGPDDIVDTDGDSNTREATDWTWLYMRLRKPRYREQPVIEVIMLEGGQVMQIASDVEVLTQKTALFLAQKTGGTISDIIPR